MSFATAMYGRVCSFDQSLNHCIRFPNGLEHFLEVTTAEVSHRSKCASH